MVLSSSGKTWSRVHRRFSSGAISGIFSVLPPWSLCLGGEYPRKKFHHGDTETTEEAQRIQTATLPKILQELGLVTRRGRIKQ